MVNTLLLRIHQSGALNELSPEQQSLLKEVITLYKSYRMDLPHALPVWPLGLPSPDSDLLCLAMDFGSYFLAAVWRIKGSDTPCRIPLPHAFAQVRQFYPGSYLCPCSLSDHGYTLEAMLPPAPSARLYRLDFE